MNKKEIFKEFLSEYLENVKKMLPESYRAKQLRTGGTPASLVYEFETKFLKRPFLNAFKVLEKRVDDKLKALHRMDAVMVDTNTVERWLKEIRGK